LGVPGSLSNRPVNVQADAGKEARTSNNFRAAVSRNYAYDRSVIQVKRGKGRINKLHVAVMLDDAVAPKEAKARSEAELARWKSCCAWAWGGRRARRPDRSLQHAVHGAHAVAGLVAGARQLVWLGGDGPVGCGRSRAAGAAGTPGQCRAARRCRYQGAAGGRGVALAGAAAGGASLLPAPERQRAASDMSMVSLLENVDLPPQGSKWM
jgi:flagellar M-ring protein FliF